jgi:hypothetical protein
VAATPSEHRKGTHESGATTAETSVSSSSSAAAVGTSSGQPCYHAALSDLHGEELALSQELSNDGFSQPSGHLAPPVLTPRAQSVNDDDDDTKAENEDEGSTPDTRTSHPRTADGEHEHDSSRVVLRGRKRLQPSTDGTITGPVKRNTRCRMTGVENMPPFEIVAGATADYKDVGCVEECTRSVQKCHAKKAKVKHERR